MKNILFMLLVVFTACSHKKEDNSIYIKNGLIYKEGENIPFTGFISDTVDNKILQYEVKDGYKNGEFKIISISKKLLMHGEIKMNKNEGVWNYFYESGELESKGSFKNDLPVDEWKWYYPNGTLKERGSFSFGKKDGEWLRFGESGDTLEHKLFINDSLAQVLIHFLN